MFPAPEYQSNHPVQVRDVIELLENYKSKMKWTRKQKIIDIGCGSGDSTYNYLLPLISSDGELTGVDISAPLINHANSHYVDPRLNFRVMNLTEKEIVEKYVSHFDSAFSFYCLQWIQDQRAAMKNLYSVLKPAGEMLFVVVADAVNYPLYERLAASPKWFPYMKDYKNATSPYRYMEDPVSYLRKLMQDEGFDIDECSMAYRSYTFESTQIFFDWIDGLNPFLENIPAHLLKEYDQECKDILHDENSLTFHQSTDKVTMNYSAITAFARKIKSKPS